MPIEEQLEITPTKTWKCKGVFGTYEEAAAQKEVLLAENDLVKIKRCGKCGANYRVTVWNEKPVKRKSGKKKK